MPSCARARWKHISFHCDIIFGYWTIILLKSKQNNFNKGIEVHRKLWMSKFHCNLLSPWIVFSRGLASTSHTFFDLYFDLKFWQESSFRCSLQVYDLDHTHLLASFKQSGPFDQRTLLVDFWVKKKKKKKKKKHRKMVHLTLTRAFLQPCSCNSHHPLPPVSPYPTLFASTIVKWYGSHIKLLKESGLYLQILH